VRDEFDLKIFHVTSQDVVGEWERA
jgi:hypothetical protein